MWVDERLERGGVLIAERGSENDGGMGAGSGGGWVQGGHRRQRILHDMVQD